MRTQPIKYQLSEHTIKNIEKSTKCSINELRTLSFDDTKTLMQKRGAIKKTNKIKQWFTDKYIKISEKLGFLKKQYNIYTDVD